MTNRRSKASDRTNHDAIFKLIFENKRVMASLLRAYGILIGLPPDWVELWDLRTLVRVPPAEKADNLTERRGDMAWFVKLRKRPGVPPGRGVLIALEIQSYDDKDMWMRITIYALLAQQQLPEDTYVIGGLRPPEIPIVIFTGKRRRKHSTRSADAHYPIGDTPTDEVTGSLTHFVLDIDALGGQDLPSNELMTCLIRQQNAKTVWEVWSALVEAFQMLKGRNENDRRTRIGFYEHARSLPIVRDDGNFQSYESLEDLLKEDNDMTTAAEANAKRWFKQVRGEGREEGREEGIAKGREEAEERAARLFAAEMFGDDTAATLALHFKAADDPNRLAKVVGWVHECRTGDELLARAQREWTPQNGVRRVRSPSRAKGTRSRNSKNRT